jgi:hypothetical protein
MDEAVADGGPLVNRERVRDAPEFVLRPDLRRVGDRTASEVDDLRIQLRHAGLLAAELLAADEGHIRGVLALVEAAAEFEDGVD